MLLGTRGWGCMCWIHRWRQEQSCPLMGRLTSRPGKPKHVARVCWGGLAEAPVCEVFNYCLQKRPEEGWGHGVQVNHVQILRCGWGSCELRSESCLCLLTWTVDIVRHSKERSEERLNPTHMSSGGGGLRGSLVHIASRGLWGTYKAPQWQRWDWPWDAEGSGQCWTLLAGMSSVLHGGEGRYLWTGGLPQWDWRVCSSYQPPWESSCQGAVKEAPTSRRSSDSGGTVWVHPGSGAVDPPLNPTLHLSCGLEM